MSFFDNLDKILSKQQELADRLARGIMGDAYIKASKEYSDLEPIVEKINLYKDAVNSLKDVQTLMTQETDKDMRELAQEEQIRLENDIPKLESAVKIALLPKDEADKKNAIVEIRAGTGGEEAALFAGVLLRMYQRYSEVKNWRFEILSLSETGIGGYKEISVLISGHNVFSRLKFESGVHRVQRVPETESSGRIHTSAATVAVLPEAEEIDVRIEEKDLRIDTYRSSGAGGQHVNTTDSAVRITHLPTGIVVTQQDERSQIKNKARAMKILMSRIYEGERERKMQERSAARKGQVGSGDRSERIRTYNFPQGRVTDHRINMTHYRIEDVINSGEIDNFIDSLISQDEANKLTEEIS